MPVYYGKIFNKHEIHLSANYIVLAQCCLNCECKKCKKHNDDFYQSLFSYNWAKNRLAHNIPLDDSKAAVNILLVSYDAENVKQ